MPKVRRSRKPPPDGWELIEPTLEELEQKMREGMHADVAYCTTYTFKYMYVIMCAAGIFAEISFVCLQRRPSHMRASASQSLCGPSLRYTIRRRGTSTTCSIAARPSAVSFTTIA